MFFFCFCLFAPFVCRNLKIIFIIIVFPQIFPFSFGEENVNEGDTISVQCTISKGDNPLNITWTLNGRKIINFNGIAVSNSKRISSLSIESVREEHSGEYVCYASNLAGTSSSSAVLNVNGISK